MIMSTTNVSMSRLYLRAFRELDCLNRVASVARTEADLSWGLEPVLVCCLTGLTIQPYRT